MSGRGPAAHPSATLATFLQPHDKPACRAAGVNPDWWFPSRGGRHVEHKVTELTKARAICRTCPLMEACADWAADTHQMFGVWGGLSSKELRDRRRCRAGRCLHPDHRREAVAA